MKNLFKLLGVFFLVGSLFVFNACNSDDEITVPDETPVDGVNVADGFYLAVTGADPVAGAVLTSEVVEAESFGSQARVGFMGGYVYLEAGDYNFVQVTEKAVVATWGGAAEDITVDGSSDCGYDTYTLVSLEENGSEFNVAASGLYRVTFDQLNSEMVIYQILQPGIIGNATPGGWPNDTQITDGSVTADGGSWSISDVVLRNGEWKVRFNCRWSVDRRVDPNAGFDASNGYVLFTNFGGTVNGLEVGGANLAQEEDGVYTITINWNSFDGWTVALDRTGDAPTLSFDPNDYNLGVIGSATAGSWDSDRDMHYSFDNDNQAHKWYGVVTLADGELKVRANDEWNFDLGGALTADGTETTLDVGGGNIASPGAGQYYIVISTSDEGDSWQATMTNVGWGIIGDAVGGWSDDIDMVAEGFDAGITSYSAIVDFGAGEYKFRAGDDWKLNLGGDLGGLVIDASSNLSSPGTGEYKVTLTFDGSLYLATVEPN